MANEQMTGEQVLALFGRGGGGARRPRYRTHANLDGLNKTEASYAAELDARMRVGEIRGWYFEAIKLRLAAKTFYTPDFLVVMADGSLELHEVKGGRGWEDDARCKIKVAAEKFPMFRFVGMQRTKSGWKIEHF